MFYRVTYTDGKIVDMHNCSKRFPKVLDRGVKEGAIAKWERVEKADG